MSDEHMKDEMESPAPEAAEAGATAEVKDAFKSVGKGLGRLFSALGSAVRDPEVQEKVKARGSAVVESVGDAINTVSDQVKERLHKDEPMEDEADEVVEGAHRELDDADAVEEIRSDLEENEEE